MFGQPARVEFSLPAWLHDYAATWTPSADIDARMAFVVEAARRNVERRSGGPFAAAVFEAESGVLVALGVNLVPTQGLSMLHAEMVALALAQRKLGVFDLGGEGLAAHELVASAEPCAMCCGAVPWSGVRRLVTGAATRDVVAAGFDEGPKPADWDTELRDRGIDVIRDRHADAAAAVLHDYVALGGLRYNGRAGRRT